MEAIKFDDNTGLVLKTIEKTFGGIKSAVYVAKQISFDLDDLIQVGMLGLYHAVERFDASKGFTFSTFAMKYIRGYILNEIDRNHAIKFSISISKEEKMQVNKTMLSIHTKFKSRHEDDEEEILERMIKNDEAFEDEIIHRIDFNSYIECLSEKAQKIVSLRVEGYSFSQIEEFTGITEKNAGKIFNRAKKKIQQEYVV